MDLSPLFLSLRVASLATLAVVLVGLPLALLLARRAFPGKAVLAGVALLPLVLPPTVLGYGLLLLLGRRSWLGGWLEQALGWTVVFHWSGAVIASGVAAFPLFLLPARSAIEGVEPRLEQVARLLGRSNRSVFWTVTLPLAWRGLAAGAILAFVRALGDFGATLMVAGDIPGRTRTVSLAIYDAAVLRNDPATALRLTLLVSLVSVAALMATQAAWSKPRRQP
jgi:molybdate transport system permease protein